MKVWIKALAVACVLAGCDGPTMPQRAGLYAQQITGESPRYVGCSMRAHFVYRCDAVMASRVIPMECSSDGCNVLTVTTTGAEQ